MALSDEAAGGVDGAAAAGAGEFIAPVVGSAAGFGFADDLCAQSAHDGEAVVDFGYLDMGGSDAGHCVGGVHGAVGAGGFEDVAEFFLQRVNGLAPAGDLDAVVLVEAEAGEAFFCGEDEGGVAIGDLGTVVGFKREAVDEIAVGAVDFGGLIEGEIDVHLGVGIELRVGVFLDGDLGEVAFGDAVGLDVELHDLGEDVGEDEGFTGAFVGVREVAEGFADALAVGFACIVAHLLDADGDGGFAEAGLELVDTGEDGLATGGAGVFYGFEGFAGETFDACHEAGDEALLMEGEVAGGGDGSAVDGGGYDADFGADALDGAGNHGFLGEGEELAEFGLVVGGDVDGLHKGRE